MAGFTLDHAFKAGSVFAADWPLCQVRLQDDARFPWLILIPRVGHATELDELADADRHRLMSEIVLAGRIVRALGAQADRPIDKLNVAALGNVTAQLHIHVVGRRRDDALWPDPVWGRGTALPYPVQARATALAVISS